MRNHLSFYHFQLYNNGDECLDVHNGHYMARITISGCSGEPFPGSIIEGDEILRHIKRHGFSNDCRLWLSCIVKNPFDHFRTDIRVSEEQVPGSTLEPISGLPRNIFRGQLLNFSKPCNHATHQTSWFLEILHSMSELQRMGPIRPLWNRNPGFWGTDTRVNLRKWLNTIMRHIKLHVLQMIAFYDWATQYRSHLIALES